MRLPIAILALCLVAAVQADYYPATYKQEVVADYTNDDAINMDAYFVVGFDGYVTQVLRLINPLAKKLKKIPFILFHGANVDMTCYLVASSIQHHPEECPQSPDSAPITSSNRSLAFMLANDCWDIWLVGTRGSNINNMGHTKYPNGTNSVPTTDFSSFNLTRGEIAYIYERTPYFWQYGFDEIIAFDVKPLIDFVLKATQSDHYYLMSFSFSTPTTMAFLAAHPDYAKNCTGYIQMGTTINAVFTIDAFDEYYFKYFAYNSPTRGIGFFPSYVFQPLLRVLLTELDRSLLLRYTLVYALTDTLLGPSPIFVNNLELNLIAHTLLPSSFKMIKQYVQNSIADSFRKFDFGLEKNLQIYRAEEPPEYDISRIEVQNYLMIYGTNDSLAEPGTSMKLMNRTSTPNPIEVIVAPYFNHLSLFGAETTDIYINLPIKDWINKHNPFG